jgi:hypothetical protein
MTHKGGGLWLTTLLFNKEGGQGKHA